MPVALPVAFLLALLSSSVRACIPTETPDYIYDQEWLEQERERLATTSVLLTTVRESTAPTTSPSSAAPTTTTTSTTTTPTTTSTTTSTTTTSTTSTTTTTPNTCPSTWTFNANNGNCYRASVTPETWQVAENTCQGYGIDAHLASISDMVESDFILDMVTPFGSSTAFWIGLQQLMGTDTFATTGSWTDNSMYNYMTDWTNWSNPPGMVGANVCAYIYGPAGAAADGKWDYQNCANSRLYICEAPAT